MRTETSYVANRAALRRYADAGYMQYEYLAGGGSRMCPVCAKMDGRVFPIAQAGKNMPPMHPRCWCGVVVTDEADGWRMAGERMGCKAVGMLI